MGITALEAATSASSSGGGLVATVFVLYFLITVVWQLFRGFKRGLFRQALHTGLVILAAIIAFSVASSVGNELLGSFSEMNTEELIAAIEESAGPLTEDVKGIISSIDPTLVEYIMMMPATTLIAPFLFTMLFLILNWLFRIAYFILHKLLPKGSTLVFRLTGLAAGVIEGMLIAGCVLLPIIGLTTIADDVVDTIAESPIAETEEVQEIINIYEAEFAPVSNNMAFAITKTFGGKAALNGMATVKDGDVKMNMRDEMISTVKLILVASTSFEGADMKAPTKDNKAALDMIIESLDDSHYISTIMASALSSIGRTVDGGKLPFEVEAPYDTIVEAAVSIFATTTTDTLHDDLVTIKDVYYILADNGVLTSMGSEDSDITEVLTKRDANGNTIVDQVINTINKNKHTRPLVTALTKLSISIICDSMDVGEEVTEVYENLKGGVNETLSTVKKENFETEEEYKEALSTSINETLVENDINLEPEIVDGIADHVAENYGDIDSISDDEFNDIMLSYYDAYLKYQETGEVPEGIVE